MTDELHTEDLALARAAGAGDTQAIASIESRYFADIGPILARIAHGTASRDELEQRLRERLFVSTPDRPAGILGYAGRGDLRGFLRVAMTRAALNLVTRNGRDRPSDDDLFDAIPDVGDDPEVRHLRDRCQAEVRAAFRAAVAALTPRERNLLRHAFFDGLGIEALARIYGVHRATAARWLAAARADLLEKLQADLRARLRIEASEIESLLRWARSGIELSLDHGFEPEPGAPSGQSVGG
ncbi:MAG: hypothetical protein HOV80_05675 [Polyangiaceae bacterium]|nr:hypothetical protein [Polyangiaceae bacterium]